MDKEHRENYSLTILGLHSKVIHLNKNIHEGGVVIKLLREKQNALKALTRETNVEALTQIEEVYCLKQSLKRARSTLDSLEEKASQPKDEVVVTSVHHFEKAIRQVIFLYHYMDLSPMDLFQIVQDRQLVYKEYFLLF